MQNPGERLRARIPPDGGGVRWEVFRRSTTYLARVAVILQDAPDKMLTFMQLMDRLGPLVREDRKSIENNIRVCLSTNDCFVKIRLLPDSLASKRNFWKLDLSHITAKMVRRHFKDILDFFPELRGRRDDGGGGETAAPSVHIRCEVKFSGPFSIESLLQRDSPAPGGTPPPAGVPVPTEHHHHHLHHHLYLAARRGHKRNLRWDSEDVVPVRVPAALPRPAGADVRRAIGKRSCAGPPLPACASNLFLPYPTYDVPHFRL
ncbi:forkhead box protein H1-like [Phyllopteryx taeniolatus]|uniref:forkhead box protein H1-like n=1 Tax=Phyllopteryx taeniolatus TaxID=161469 RepID=UPI002AD41666|nr:forkhead box protein H1-like [Phyllopteryx taeniolatus]XP_061615354.1 forkhead box protein H1-like [Phyllopteryx taeniolatus]